MVQHIHQNSLENTLRQEGPDFIFSDVPYNGKVIPEVRLLGNLMDDGSKKTHDGWRGYCHEHPEAGTVLTSEMAYQLARKLYALCNDQDSAVQQARDSCLALLHKDYTRKYPHTGTKIIYLQGLDVVVNHLEPQCEERTIPLRITEFNWSYLVLANEQPESALGNVEDISENAKQVLKTLLGEGYKETGAVWQFVSPRRNRNLCEVRLWVPIASNRNIERCVVFGVSYVSDSFDVGADDDINDLGPARGWVANSK